MDRSQDFFNSVEKSSLALNKCTSPALLVRSSPSPFIIKACDMRQKIISFDALVRSCYESYIDYHRYLPKRYLASVKRMSDSDRFELNKEMQQFIAALAAEIQDLNRHVETIDHHHLGMQIIFYKKIISSLLGDFSEFTKTTERMQHDFKAKTASPFRMMSQYYASAAVPSSPGNVVMATVPPPAAETSLSETINASSFSSDGGRGERGDQDTTISGTERADGSMDRQPPASSAIASFGASLLSSWTSSPATASGGAAAASREDTANRTTTTTTTANIPKSFAQRYIDEIAPPSKMKEYNHVASTQKEKLLKESQLLHLQYSDDMREANRMEHTITSISGMMSEFASLIESQSEAVEDIHMASKDATEQVSSTSSELQLTLDRSRSHEWSMTVFILLLSFLLLFLDFVTP